MNPASEPDRGPSFRRAASHILAEVDRAIHPKADPYRHLDGSRECRPALPDRNPKTAQGFRKPPVLSVIPATALLQVGAVMRLGKAKYGPFNWRDEGITASTYVDAAFRHLASWWDGESIDPESGASHIAHAVAGLLILLDAQAQKTLADDRPTSGRSAALIARFADRQSFDEVLSEVVADTAIPSEILVSKRVFAPDAGAHHFNHPKTG